MAPILPAPPNTRKRPYQPSIAAFFRPSSPSTIPSDSPSNPTGHAADTPVAAARPASTLPLHIQSSLLNVGMRVRKAVTGGYSIHKSLDPASVPAPTPLFSDSRPRELQLYAWGCSTSDGQQEENAMHAVGGWAVQTGSFIAKPRRREAERAAALWEDDVDARMPSGLVPNNSTGSTDAMPVKKNKRAFDDEQGDAEDGGEDKENVRYTLNDFGGPIRLQRQFARPRPRIGSRRSLGGWTVTPQTDFGEADFLRGRDELMDTN